MQLYQRNQNLKDIDYSKYSVDELILFLEQKDKQIEELEEIISILREELL